MEQNLEGTPDRRTVLRGALVLGMAGLSGATLAGCGGGGDTAAQAAGSRGPVAGTTLGPTTDVPIGGGKVFAQALVVVTQPKKGTFRAFSAVCTHEGCPVNQVAKGLITCPCHGSKYSIRDGSVQGGPAPAPLPAVQITTTGGTIAVA
jgi:Rieske Fe-S protein